VGEGEHVADGGLVSTPLAAVAPVLGVDFVALVFGVLAVPEAAQLLLLADVEPNLMTMTPCSTISRSNSFISAKARRHSTSRAKPSSRSTSTRPYHERS